MRLLLKVISSQSSAMGEQAEHVFDEHGGSFGRASANDWVLPDPDRYVSGYHGRVSFDDGSFFVHDSSANGLIIQGHAAAIGKGHCARITDGDVLLLGDYRIQALLAESVAAVERRPTEPMAQVVSEPPLSFGVEDHAPLMCPSGAEVDGSVTQAMVAGESYPEDSVDPGLYDAFLRGLGVASGYSKSMSTTSMAASGRMVRRVIQSTIDLMKTRSTFKNRLRMYMTQVAEEDNNPLKFSPTADEALRSFFGPRSVRYLSLEEAMVTGLKDMELHQIGLDAGVEAIVAEMSRLMDPNYYSGEGRSGVASFFSLASGKSRRWDQFCGECDRIGAGNDAGVQAHFARTFSEAYEDAVRVARHHQTAID